MGSTGTRAVKAPILVEPYPTAAVSKRLASVQLRESMPWLHSSQCKQLAPWASSHVLKQLSKRARSSRTARLLAVDIVHSRVHPHTERETVVYP